MRRSRFGRRVGVIAALVATWAAVPSPATSQGGRGFLFRKPTASVGLEFGYVVPRGRSDLFQETFETLTVKRSDLRAGYLGAQLSVPVSARWAIAATLGGSRSETPSEFWDYQYADNGAPIEQVTRLTMVPVTVSAKYYFADRGRSIGRFAWIPTRFVPYVGAGVGAVHYRFEQEGDFVDYTDLTVFSDRLDSSGETGTVELLGGAELSLNKTLFLTGEARYAWAMAGLRRPFAGYDLDLSGLRMTIGISANF